MDAAMRSTLAICLLGGLSAVTLTACSGDDNATPVPGDGGSNDGSALVHTDGGGGSGDAADGNIAVSDSSSTEESDGSDGSVGSDASDGGPCDFATFVLNLVDNDTTMTALPSTDLGQNCVDQQNQAQFSVLFQ
jgi:hypothetical protein